MIPELRIVINLFRCPPSYREGANLKSAIFIRILSVHYCIMYPVHYTCIFRLYLSAQRLERYRRYLIYTNILYARLRCVFLF